MPYPAGNLERVRFNLLRKCRGPQADLTGEEGRAERYLGSEQTIVDVEVPGVVKVRRGGYGLFEDEGCESG